LIRVTRIQIGIPWRSKQWMTHDRWRDVVQYLLATLSVWRRATFLHCYDVMEFRSEFWCSRNCSSTAFPGSALRVIWYFYHMADRHPRSCDISFEHFCIFFIKTPIRVWLKVSETSFRRKGIPWGHLAWFWKGLHVYFFQIVVFVWRINACTGRVYDKSRSYVCCHFYIGFVMESYIGYL
jgi:hypothetical protein